MNLKNIKIFLFLTLALIFSACSSKEYIKLPCEYPQIKVLPTIPTVKVVGIEKCFVQTNKKYINIGKCLDTQNFTKLTTKIHQQKLIIKAYEKKISAYNDKYVKENDESK